jgi:hypothetical protein
VNFEKLRAIMVDEIAGRSAIGLARLTDEQMLEIATRITDLVLEDRQGVQLVKPGSYVRMPQIGDRP